MRVLRAVHAPRPRCTHSGWWSGTRSCTIVERRPAALRRIHPVAEVEDVEARRRRARPADGRAGSRRCAARARRERPAAAARPPTPSSAASIARRPSRLAGANATTSSRRRASARPAASRGCSCRRRCADATAARRRRRSSPVRGGNVLRSRGEHTECPRVGRRHRPTRGLTSNVDAADACRGGCSGRRASSAPSRSAEPIAARPSSRDRDGLRAREACVVRSGTREDAARQLRRAPRHGVRRRSTCRRTSPSTDVERPRGRRRRGTAPAASPGRRRPSCPTICAVESART